MDGNVGWSASQRLVDRLPLNLIETFIVPSGRIVTTGEPLVFHLAPSTGQMSIFLCFMTIYLLKLC